MANKIEPPPPVDHDLFEMPADEPATIGPVPASLEEAMDALEAGNDYLKAGGMFTPGLIETWVDYKRSAEIDPVRLRPPPCECILYYDI